MKVPADARRNAFFLKQAVARLAVDAPGTIGAVAARARVSTDAVLLVFLFASLPAFVVRAWLTGRQAISTMPVGAAPDWHIGLVERLGLQPATGENLAAVLLGLTWLVPTLILALLTSLAWAGAFAVIRKRALDPGWLLAAWLYVLLLPADLSPVLVILGISFGVVVGKHMFGGTGYYVASPAALGVLFLQFSYPGAGELSLEAGWTGLVAGDAASASLAMPLACLAGALFLVRAGVASPRTLVGAVVSVAVAAMLASAAGDSAAAGIDGYRHLLPGLLPVVLVFVLTDPSSAALTRGGRWLHGVLFGVLVVMLRVMDPTHPEGSLIAVLLAALGVPLVDYLALRRHLAARGPQLELR